MDTTQQRQRELADFLKTRRAKISPAQVGLPHGERRRTAGLRREEVASLAGVSVTWYTWLEQGRSIQVSGKLLQNLAKALLLDAEETTYLYTLAQQAPPVEYPFFEPKLQSVHQHVLDSLLLSPSLILDNRWNVIAWNRAAEVVFMDFGQIPVSQRNIVRIMFTNTAYQRLFEDWEAHAEQLLARFRTSYGKFISDPWLSEFIAELKQESGTFEKWWSMHKVEAEQEREKCVLHPELGQLYFEHASYIFADDLNLRLYINTPIEGSDTYLKLKERMNEVHP
jgi:transcriptional regulator with XRE-family HTH domain